jgi:uncharacterized protein (TIGR03437 family)
MRSLLGLSLIATVGLAAPHPSLPFAFEKNAGQTHASVRYFGRAPGAGLWLMDSGAVLTVDQQDRQAVLRMTLEGARPHPQIEGCAQLAGYSNYFTGNDESKWHTHVPLFERVRYRDAYPGIDLVFHGQTQTLEYDWVVAPGADPNAIRMSFRGANKINIDHAGDLVLEIAGIEIRQKRPHIYQQGREIAGRFVRRGRAIGFEVDAYNSNQALTIDPVLTYATYLGTAAFDTGIALAIDPKGFLLLMGNTNSPAFPAKHGVFSAAPNTNRYPYVAKIDPTASGSASLVWLTVLGGSVYDAATTLASDAQGDALVAGWTHSSNFPVKNAFQPNMASTIMCAVPTGGAGPCPDAFVAKIASTGDSLIYSSYLGGDHADEAYAVAVDGSGNAWISGYARSDNFPATPNAYQRKLSGTQNGFIVGVSPAGALIYSTLLGGEKVEYIFGEAVDPHGNVYVVGQTTSAHLPIVNPFQPALASSADGFVAKLNPGLSGAAGLLYSTYVGGSGGITELYSVAADAQGNIYATGGTNAPDYPVTPQSAIDSKFGGVPPPNDPDSHGVLRDAVVTKLTPALQGAAQLAYSTYLGGALYDFGWSVAVDDKGRIVVAGQTDSPDFPVTADGFEQIYTGAQFSTKAFVAIVDPSIKGADGLVYSTYFGGSSGDISLGLALHATGVAIAGNASSTNMPVTPSAYQPKNAGGPNDAFVALFDLTKTGPTITAATNAASFLPAGAGAAPGEMVTFFGNLLGPATLVGSVLDASGKLPTTVAGCQVLIDGTPAPIVYVWTKQSSVILPYELTPNIGQDNAVFAQVVCNGVAGNIFPLQVASSAPGIFSAGNGQAAVLNANGSPNSASNPAAKGSIVQIFATGEGVLAPAGEDGHIENGPVSGIPKPVLPVSVTFGNIASPQIPYAGVAPQAVDGLLQVNAQIPSNAPSGNVAIVLTIGPASSQPALTIAVK